jgi:hypothetical protein
MRKLKKMIALITSTLLMAVPFMSMGLTAKAVYAPDEFYWRAYAITGFDASEAPITGMVVTDKPIDATFVSVESENYWVDLSGMYANGEELIDSLPAGYIEEHPDNDYEAVKNMKTAIVTGEISDWFYPGDTVTVRLPFSGINFVTVAPEEWSATFTSNSVTLTALDYVYKFQLIAAYNPNSEGQENEFWFVPMRTQLNIAAETAQKTGKEAVAEAAGDFALSYDIMKWLEDHPNVTLKYTLLYKGEAHNIVIKGGQKLAFADIPWYGPEYLIGKFKK